jgi:MFS-type transporter involved in bile tolerance (Atg22 family)
MQLMRCGCAALADTLAVIKERDMNIFTFGFTLGIIGCIVVGIIISGGTFGQRCSNYTDSAYQECLIRLSNGGEP